MVQHWTRWGLPRVRNSSIMNNKCKQAVDEESHHMNDEKCSLNKEALE